MSDELRFPMLGQDLVKKQTDEWKMREAQLLDRCHQAEEQLEEFKRQSREQPRIISAGDYNKALELRIQKITKDNEALANELVRKNDNLLHKEQKIEALELRVEAGDEALRSRDELIRELQAKGHVPVEKRVELVAELKQARRAAEYWKRQFKVLAKIIAGGQL